MSPHAQTGLDPAEIRRRNLIKPAQIPYTTFVGGVYDSGDFPAIFEKALAAADYDGFAARKAAVASQGQAARHRHRLLSGDLRRPHARGRRRSRSPAAAR